MQKFYDGTKLLSLMDINGNKPEIYICTSNRNAGKTTYFSRLCVNRFLKHGEKFAILYRFKYELDDCAENFFKDIGALFFKDHEMTSKAKANGIYHELYLDKISCGYAISINSADQLKRRGHLFSDVSRILFDEFQSETNHYCDNEIRKFMSIHTSIARGGGDNIRYLPVYMLSNPVSILNPYYVHLDISKRLTDNVKFLRGAGYVVEQGYVDYAAENQKKSGFNQAFANSDYLAYAAEGVYLNDIKSFIDKPQGQGRYLATIKFMGKEYAVREYAHEGIVYCDDKVDKTFTDKLVVTTEDHNINYVMLHRNSLFITMLRNYFEHGAFRFKDLDCKNAILKTLSY